MTVDALTDNHSAQKNKMWQQNLSGGASAASGLTKKKEEKHPNFLVVVKCFVDLNEMRV